MEADINARGDALLDYIFNREGDEVRDAQEEALLAEPRRNLWLLEGRTKDGGDDDDNDNIPPEFRLNVENIRRYYQLARQQVEGLPGRFREQTTLFRLRAQPLDDLLRYHDGDRTLAVNMLQDAIDRFLPQDRQPQDLIHVHISHNRLRHGDIRQMRRVANWNIEAVMIARVLQSNDNWVMGLGNEDDGFIIYNLMYIRRPEVGGMFPGRVDMADYLKKKVHIIYRNKSF